MSKCHLPKTVSSKYLKPLNTHGVDKNVNKQLGTVFSFKKYQEYSVRLSLNNILKLSDQISILIFFQTKFQTQYPARRTNLYS